MLIKDNAMGRYIDGLVCFRPKYEGTGLKVAAQAGLAVLPGNKADPPHHNKTPPLISRRQIKTSSREMPANLCSGPKGLAVTFYRRERRAWGVKRGRVSTASGVCCCSSEQLGASPSASLSKLSVVIYCRNIVLDRHILKECSILKNFDFEITRSFFELHFDFVNSSGETKEISDNFRCWRQQRGSFSSFEH